MKILLIICLAALTALDISAAQKPNIIFILADDMGYGDMSHSGGKVATPHCDRLAAEGMRFTDAHTSSSVCTPTRYGILTGRYNWRSRLKKRVLSGYSDPLIPTSRQTVAGFLREQGYHTKMVGKWHLGIGWQRFPNGEKRVPKHELSVELKNRIERSRAYASTWEIDYSKPVIGPVANGFDSFWGIAASLDMPPYVYINDDRVEELPTTTKAFFRPGPSTADFEANQCLIHFAEKSREYIRSRGAKKDQPFFLYLPLTSPHTPIVPSARWRGRAAIGDYGDFLMETDWVIGEVLAELEAQGIDDNTMIIFTSDNGCSPTANIGGLIGKGHKPNADWRGNKADIFEGGHRVPFLVRWPAQVKAASVTDSTICTTDFFATAAEAVGALKTVKDNVAEDSFSFYGELTGGAKTKRQTTIHHSINGTFAIRQGKWKLNLCGGSGGWSFPRPDRNKDVINKLPVIQLYDLSADPREEKNLQAENPEVVAKLVKTLAAEIKAGRITPGATQKNNGSIPFPENILKLFPELKN